MDFTIALTLPHKHTLICPWCGVLLTKQYAKVHVKKRIKTIMYRCPQCQNQVNYTDCASTPTMFDVLPCAERQRMTDWVERNIVPNADEQQKTENTYVIKNIYQEQYDTYTYSGCMNGALLLLGYRPLDTTKMDWTFDVRLRVNSTTHVGE